MSKYHKTKQEILSELEVIEKAKNNPEAFRALYDTYYREIFTFIYKRVNEEEITADIASQVFVKAMIKIKSYRFKGVPFSAWLYRIASNEVNQYFRKTKANRTISLEESGLHRLKDEVDDDAGQHEEQRSLLLKALQYLNEKEVQLLELRFFEDRPFKEVAVILNITETNAKVKTYRLIEKVKKIVGDIGA